MDKKIADLGKVSGKMLLFGGVYSNLQALETLMSIAEKENINPSHCICTGDIVGYCAQPEEVVQEFKAWSAKSIAGNVELQLANDEDDCGCDFKVGSRCDSFSKMWFPYAKSRLSEDSLDWIRRLPDHLKFTYAGKSVTVVHGSYDNVSEYIFKSSPSERKEPQFNATASDLIIAGHCGLPFHEELSAGIWLNPGVIGMPANDGTPRVWYIILEEHKRGIKYTHRNFVYDHHTTKQLMLTNFLPESYADTLISGIWDNMEILPQQEKNIKGQIIRF